MRSVGEGSAGVAVGMQQGCHGPGIGWASGACHAQNAVAVVQVEGDAPGRKAGPQAVQESSSGARARHVGAKNFNFGHKQTARPVGGPMPVQTSSPNQASALHLPEPEVQNQETAAEKQQKLRLM